MNKIWNTYEKIIAGFLIILGVLVLTIIILAINLKVQSIIGQPEYSINDISFYKLIKTYYHQILTAILGISSGFMLLRTSRIGWIMSVSTFLIYGIGTIVNILLKKYEGVRISELNSELFFVLLIAFLFLTLAISLTNKQFRIKYLPNRKSWLAIGIISMTFMIDLMINR